MKSLSHYKGKLIDLREAEKQAKSERAKRECQNAVKFYSAKVRLKEQLVGIGLMCLMLSIARGAVSPNDMERLLDAIRIVESSNRICVSDGDDGQAIGPYQIHSDYWIDGTKFLGVSWPYEQAKDPIKSRQVVRAYLAKYGAGLDIRAMARIHKGGPRGYKKTSTEAYAKKVMRVLEWKSGKQ